MLTCHFHYMPKSNFVDIKHDTLHLKCFTFMQCPHTLGNHTSFIQLFMTMSFLFHRTILSYL